MDEAEFKRMERLYILFMESENICDPIEYVRKKKGLIHGLISFILEPYYEEVKRRNEIERER